MIYQGFETPKKKRPLPFCPASTNTIYAHVKERVSPIYWYWRQVVAGEICPICGDAKLEVAK